jgi:hypothetical protein
VRGLFAPLDSKCREPRQAHRSVPSGRMFQAPLQFL